MMENEKTVPADQEEQKALGRVLLAKDTPIEEIMKQTTLSKPAILGLKGALIKANKRLEQPSKPALLKAKPSEAISEPQIENEADFQPQPEGDNFHDLSHSTPSGIPEGYALKPALTPSEWNELAKLDKSKLMSMVTELKASNSSLQAQAHMQKHNGDQAHKPDDSPLTQRELIQYAQTQKLLDSRTPTKTTENLTEDKIERIVERAIQRSEKGDPVEKALDTVGKLYSKLPKRTKRHKIHGKSLKP